VGIPGRLAMPKSVESFFASVDMTRYYAKHLNTRILSKITHPAPATWGPRRLLLRIFDVLGYSTTDPLSVLETLEKIGIPYEMFFKALTKCAEVARESGVRVSSKHVQVFKDYEDPAWTGIVMKFKTISNPKEAQRLWDELARTAASVLGPYSKYVYTEVEPP